MSEFNDTLEKLAAFAEATSIWKPASVDQEPETRLLNWRVMLVEGKDTHFVGRANWEGRVCSAVQTYDPKTKRGVTKSGRVYELLGPSGFDRDAMYVWSRWMHINGLEEKDIQDITSQYDNGEYK